MDYVRVFDVELDRPVFYAGEMLSGHIYLEVSENMRLQNIKVLLRGKAHAEWKITRAGERRCMKQDEQYIEERLLLWGKDDSDAHQGVPIMTRGRHRLPFHFQLPESALPCSFESKIGSIRYYVRVTLNIPYASCPQCIRYFTIVGPNIDCTDERFLSPVSSTAKRNSCSLCCGRGPLLLRATLDRTSFVCGEHVSLKAEVQNGSDAEVWITCKLVQYVEFFINKGVLGLSKEVRHTVLEVNSDKVPAHDSSRLDELAGRLVVPVTPPTMVEVCGLVQIYYTLKLYLETSKGKGDGAEINFPITIATVPYRLPNNPAPDIHYEVAASNTEGGMYISPEFQLGQVYMGEEVDPETDQTILYRPVYVCINGSESLSRASGNLLQVPSRQASRIRENVHGSREGIHHEHITSSHQSKVDHAAMFQVEGSPVMVKPEDKFLKEITAKIANRQIAIGGDGEGVPGLRDENEVSEISSVEAHMQRMRKQKQPTDSMHQALVSELRRHLSEGEEGTTPLPPHIVSAGAELPEKIPVKRPVKKTPPLTQQKPSSDIVTIDHPTESGSSSPGPPGGGTKRLKTDTGDREPLLPEAPPPPPSFVTQSVESDAQQNLASFKVDLACSNEEIKPLAAAKEVNEEEEEDLDCSEHSALLRVIGPSAASHSVDEYGEHEKQTFLSSNIETVEMMTGHTVSPAGQSFHHLPHMAVGESELLETNQGKRENLEEEMMSLETSHTEALNSSRTEKNMDSQMKTSPNTISKPSTSFDHEIKTSDQTTRSHSPAVAPKPRGKDRHSFPAAHAPLQPGAIEHSEMPKENLSVSIESGARPKSEIVKTSKERDSMV